MCANSCATRAVTEVLREGDVVPLHTAGRRCVTVGQGTIDHVKACLPLIQPQFEIGRLRIVEEVHSVPFDVKDTVWRSARDRHEDATPVCPGRAAAQTYVGAQIIPIREDGVAVACARQASVGEDRGIATELQCTVGVHIRSRVGLIVERIRERQRDGGHAVVAMIADVGRAWHDAPADLSDRISSDARCRGRRRRRRGACRCRGGWRRASCR